MRDKLKHSIPGSRTLPIALCVGAFFFAGYLRSDVGAAVYDKCHGIVGSIPCLTVENEEVLDFSCTEVCATGFLSCFGNTVLYNKPAVDIVSFGQPNLEAETMPGMIFTPCAPGEGPCTEDPEESECIVNEEVPTVDYECQTDVPAGGSCRQPLVCLSWPL